MDPRRVALVLLAATLCAHRATADEAGLPPPVVPRGFGVNIHFTHPIPGEMARFAEAGYGLVRMDFAWAGIERRPGVYDFSAFDHLIAELDRVHARALLILDYGNRLYDDGLSPHTDAGRAAFARFAAAGAAHFKGKGVIWEIWNEPNIGFWKPKPNVDDYVKLAVATARSVRAADPSAVVLAPGSSGFPWPFFESAFRQGLLEHVDAVSVHPYRSGAPETAADDYGRLRALIARFAPVGKRGMPIVSSEWGYSTRTGGNVSESRQAQYLARQWLANLASGVDLSIFYDWKDDGPDPRENEHRFGTVRQDLAPKPSFLAAKGLIHALSGYTYRHRLKGRTDADWRLLFQRGDGDELAVASWSAAPDASEADATPRFRPVGPTDPDFAGLRALAGVRFRAGPRAESNAEPAVLEVSAVGGDLTVAPSVSSAARTEIAAGTTRRIEVPAAALRPEHRHVSIAFLRDDRPLPELTPLSIWRVDPVTLSAAPRGGMLEAAITCPAGPFSGRLVVEVDRRESASVPVAWGAGGADHLQARLPLPSTAHRLLLRDGQGTVVGLLDERRHAAMSGFPDRPVRASGFASVLFVDNAGRPAVPVPAVAAGAGGPSSTALEVRLEFDGGWRYLGLTVPAPARIPSGARALTLWIHPSGMAADDHLRCRLRDASGQVHQPDLGQLGPPGWRAITIPLDGRGPASHWGGANDGVVHPPLTWESLILVDSASRQPHQGTLLLASPSYVFEAKP